MGFERWLGVIAGVTAGLGVMYWMWGPKLQEQLSSSEPEVVAPAPPQTPPPQESEAAPQYPVPNVAEATETGPKSDAAAAPKPVQPPAGDLAASDASVRDSLTSLFGAAPIETFLVPERVVQKIVATVDSLDGDPVPLRQRAILNVPQLPIVNQSGDTITLATENGERYRMLIAAVEHADARQIAGLYLRYYALFQRAYEELGYPRGYFNDRAVQIIDHLLATPELPGPIELVRPKVLYQFKDPELEELSSGQKAMLRLGRENEAVVKGKLREVREVITARKPSPPKSDAG
jgi:hypothetical protein